MKLQTKRSILGYTLIELLIISAIMVITIALAASVFRNNYIRQQLKQASWELYSDMLYARSLATTINTAIYLNYQTGSSWCYGLSDQGSCNCNTVNSCRLSGVEKVVKSASYNSVSLAASGFSSTNLVFENSRGVTSTGSGALTFSRGGFSIQVKQNNNNNILICSNNISGFPTCS